MQEISDPSGDRRRKERVELMAARLQELRQAAAAIRDLEQLVPAGSQLYRGLALVQRDLQNAEHHLQRLCGLAGTMPD